MHSIIDLCTSSPKAKEVNSVGSSVTKNKGRINTPEFAAFRERWLAFDDEIKKEGLDVKSTPRSVLMEEIDATMVEAIDSPAAKVKRRQHGKKASTEPMAETTITLDAGQERFRSIESSRPIYTSSLRIPRTKADALPEITILFDEDFFAQYKEILSPLESTLSFLTIRQSKSHYITWRRLTCDGSEETLCPYIAMIFDAQEIHSDIRSGEEKDLEKFIQQKLQDVSATSFPHVYFLIIEGRGVLNKITTEVNRQLRQCLKAGEKFKLTPTKMLPTWSELEQRLWLQGMEAGIHFQFINKREDLYSHLLEMTKCIAWQPYAHRHDQHNFCTTSNKTSGKTCQETWSLILQEIDRVTPNIAQSIVSRFPTVSSLLCQYEGLNIETADALLANIPTDERRSIGPALSKRIHRVLTGALLSPDDRIVL